MRKVHFSEIDPFSFGREVAEEILNAAGCNEYQLRVYSLDFGPFWDRVWSFDSMIELTDEKIESGEYLRWQEEAESAMRVCLDEQS